MHFHLSILVWQVKIPQHEAAKAIMQQQLMWQQLYKQTVFRTTRHARGIGPPG